VEEVFHEVLHGITEVLQAIKALSPLGQAAIRQTMTEVLHEIFPHYGSRQQDQEKGITGVLPIVPTILQPTTEEGHTEGVPGHTALPQPDTHGMPSILPLEAPFPGDEQEGDTEGVQGITEGLPHENQEVPHDSGGMTEVLPKQTPGHAPEQEGHTEVLHDKAAFDATRFALGKLCINQHEYQETGQTLYRLPKYVCPQCDAARARERRARQKAAQTQED
jgi:hypothetical protein